MNFPLDPCYADQVVDGAGLQNGGMLNGNTFPSANLFFGDAVSNAQQLIAAQAKSCRATTSTPTAATDG